MATPGPRSGVLGGRRGLGGDHARRLAPLRTSAATPGLSAHGHGVTGLVLWVAYLATGRPVLLAWVAFAVLFVNNGLGDTLLVRGHRERRGRSEAVRDYGHDLAGRTLPQRKSGSHLTDSLVPVTAIEGRQAVLALFRRRRPLAHALLAGITFFSVLLAALGVGTDP